MKPQLIEKSEILLAGLRSRAAAFALDYILIAAYILVLTAVSSLLLWGPLRPRTESLFDTPMRRDGLAFFTLVLPVILYFTAGESSAARGTWGKRKRNLQVVDREGQGLSRTRAFIRSALKFLPWQLVHTSLFHIPGWPSSATSIPLASQIGLGMGWILVGANVISMLTGRQRQTLYDRIVGSVVIKK